MRLDKRHAKITARKPVQRRIREVLEQLGGEQARKALFEEVLERLAESECEEDCRAVSHLDQLYRLTLDTLIEHWQEQKKERLQRWGMDSKGC